MFGQDQQLSIVIKARDEASRTMKRIRSQVGQFANEAQKRIGGRVSQAFTNLRSRLQTMVPTLQSIRTTASIAFAAMAFGLSRVIEASGRAQEIEKQFEATFSTTESMMRDWVSTLSNQLGRAESDIMKLAATSAGTLIPAFDIAEETVAKMTQDLSVAAVAMTAYDNRIDDAQQAMTGFTQALIGNRQRVLEWGFQIREGQLKQEALKRGLVETERQLTQQEEALLSYKLIIENTDLSMNALVRSTLAYKEQQRRLKGDIKEAAETFGETLRPALTQTFGVLRELLDSFRTFTKNNPAFVRALAAGTTAMFALAGGGAAVLLALNAILAHPIVATLAAVGAIVTFVSAQFLELAGDVGGARNAFTLLGKHLVAVWGETTAFLLEKINTIVKHIPFIGEAFDKVVQRASENARALREDFNRTALEMEKGAKGAADGTGEMNEEMRLAQEAVDSLHKLDISEFFGNAANAAKDAAGEVRNFAKEANNAVTGFLEKDKESRTEIAEEIVKQERRVAELEKKLTEQKADVKTKRDQERLREIRTNLEKERSALQMVKEQELVTEKRITAAKEKLNKTEFERTINRIQQEREKRQEELQEKLATLAAEKEAIKATNQQIMENEREHTKERAEQEEKRTKKIKEEVDDRIVQFNRLQRARSRTLSTGPLAPVVPSFGATAQTTPSFNFQHGGVVPGPIGTPQPIIAHGQERVIPAGRSGGGGATLNVSIGQIVVGDRNDVPSIRDQIEEVFRSIALNHKLGDR